MLVVDKDVKDNQVIYEDPNEDDHEFAISNG